MVSTENKLQRRGFLKSTGMAIVGLGAGPKLTRIERLEPQECEALVTLLKGMWEPGIDRMLSPTLVNYWLTLTRHLFKNRAQDEAEEKKRKEELIYRDSLPGPEKLEYIVSQLTEQLQHYDPGFLREILDGVLGGETGPADWIKSHDGKDYLVGKVSHMFEGCSQGLREKVVEKYLNDVMPALEAEWREEEDEQNTYDEFMALTKGKSIKQIRELTTKIRAEIL